MTKRAILWCGHVREVIEVEDAEGRVRPMTDAEAEARGLQYDADLPTDDFKIQTIGLELAFEAALALGVKATEIHACLVRDDLAPRNLRTAPRRATVEDLQRLVTAIARRSEPDDSLLFIAVNHGIKNEGLATSDPPVDELDDERPVVHLTPAKLEECLSPLRGPQVVIVAACYAGLFLPLGTRENRMVIVGCKEDEPYWVHRHDHAWPAFLDELFGAWCGVAFSDLVPKGTTMPLTDAFARAAQRLNDAKAKNLPLCSGAVSWPTK